MSVRDRPACPRCGALMTETRWMVKCYACGWSRDLAVAR